MVFFGVMPVKSFSCYFGTCFQMTNAKLRISSKVTVGYVGVIVVKVGVGIVGVCCCRGGLKNGGGGETEYEEKDIDEGVRTPSSDEFTNEEKLDDEETMDYEEDDEVRKELYEDVNVNLEKVMLRRPMLIKEVDEPVQSSSVSSGFTSKFLNLENPSLGENEIASLMETLAPHATTILEITSGFTTTTSPPPPFFNPPLQQQNEEATCKEDKSKRGPDVPLYESVSDKESWGDSEDEGNDDGDNHDDAESDDHDDDSDDERT
nr:hypothetical protein [Tanacetum cinerariifolium]